VIGMIGGGMSCECGCASEAPAASPWLLNTSTYSKRGSFLRSRMRSRNASRTSATASVESVASEAAWSGVSITISWAPTPFIRSKSPSPVGSRSPSIRSAGNLFAITRYDHPGSFGARPLRDHPRPPSAGRRRHAARQRRAALAVTREAARARQDEVAEPREAGKRPGRRAERDRETRHLGEAARDERRARVLAEAEPVGEAGRDGHHVLQRAARLGAHDVLARVEPELARAEPPLERPRQAVLARRDDGGGRAAHRHLPRARRARHRRDPRP